VINISLKINSKLLNMNDIYWKLKC